ncbi:MAG: isoaspartyl peptidase/L-asparaginase [Mycobacterium sp.]
MQVIRAPRPGGVPYSLAVHGGAGARHVPLTAAESADFHEGLRLALTAGRDVLHRGGSALDAVCAAVVELEDDPLFNAGHGAALTDCGTAELDAAVMTGAGAAGAVAVATCARNPVLAARSVMECTPHVLLVAPTRPLIESWGLRTAAPEDFITSRRQAELERTRRGLTEGTRHGTVGAVARDGAGHLAAATSTGGITNQMTGRVGDTPIIGAGTYANDQTVAISCTGDGENFIRGAVAFDVHARIQYLGTELGDAVEHTFAERLDATGGSGGMIAVNVAGDVVLGFNSAAMFRGYLAGDRPITAV